MRMVATDLDGTVVRSDRTISERTLKAFRACEDAGIDVVFVTGRPPRWMTPIAEMTGHRGLALCGNGAAVLDLADGAVVQSDALDAATVRDVAHRLRAHLPGAAFALETLDGLRCEPEYELRYDVGLEIARAPLDRLLDDDPTVLKILCRQGGEHARSVRVDEMLARAREALENVAEPVHSDPLNHMLEISAPGVTKGTALARLASSRGIGAQDVVAFGDMPNDAPMLAWAGTGYAMTGGHPEAVRAADALAPPCDEDGVAQVLETLLAR